jgi:HTH-type transcriptional regulator / antitoxin HigA
MTKLTMHPVRTDADYRAIMARINVLAAINPTPGTADGDELEVLSLLVRSYEDVHFPIGVPTLEQAIDFRAEQMGLTPKDLDQIFGGSGRRSEVLAGKRALSKAMASRLHAIGVPDSLLLRLLINGEAKNASRHRRTVKLLRSPAKSPRPVSMRKR